MSTIPFLDLKASYYEIKDEIDSAILKSLASGWYIGGNTVSDFEQEFAEYCNAYDCVSVGSGLDALKIAMESHGLSAGDRVLVPGHTFIATWLAVSAIGCIPVPVDVRHNSMLVSEDDFIAQLTTDVKCVVPVLLYGETADYSHLIKLCNERGIAVVIDAAQAHGARMCESHMLNHCTHAWSFYPGKNLGVFGDGGAITYFDTNAAGMARKLSNYGSSMKYSHEIKGQNSRLDPIQAAILSTKLKYLDEWNRRRQRIADLYSANLKNVSVPVSVHLQNMHVFHLYVIRTEHRNALQRYLHIKGIGTQIHYPMAVHKQNAFKEYNHFSLPNAEKVCQEILSLPCGPHLDESSVIQVIDAINKFDPDCN